MRSITNILLTGVLLSLFVVPIIGVGSLIDFGDFKGFVAGVNTVTGQEINIIPNVQNFNGYVDFSPSEIKDGVYSDLVGVTSFQRQKATYRGLYSVYNVSESKTVSLKVVTSGLSEPNDAFETLIVSLGDGDYTNTLTSDLAIGATTIPVADSDYYNVDDYIYVGSELAQVVAKTSKDLVVEPLQQQHLTGEIVYPQSIVLTTNDLVHPETLDYVLGPGERVQVNVVVQGTASLLKQDQMLHLPLEFRMNEVN